MTTPGRDEILARLREILERSFELAPEDVVPEAHLFDDLDLDSIDAIDLAVRLEEETGLRLDEEELKAVRLVSEVVDVVQEKLQRA